MSHITKCKNNSCEMREKCKRFTAVTNPIFQSWMYYICEGREWYFIDNGKNE